MKVHQRHSSLPPAFRSVLCPPPCPLAVSSLSSPLSWVGGGEGGGGGGRPRCPSSGVSTSQARRRHEARHLSLCRGGGACRVAPVVVLPTLRSHPRCPPRWGLHGACFLRARSCGPSGTLSPLPPHLAALSSGGGGGGGAVRPSLPSSPTLGGAEVCVWGGKPCRHPFVARMSQARRKHGTGTWRGTCPSAGGGACRVAPVVALPTLRSHPRWSPRWGLRACSLPARSCGPSRTPRRCLHTLPLCPRGKGRFSPPPTCIPNAWGGGGVWGGGGAPLSSSLRSTHVAGTTQAWRRHEARHLSLCRGGGLAVCHLSSPLLPCVRTPGWAEVCGGGGGALVVVPSLHACRTHDASRTQARGEALGCIGGGGGSPLGLPALLHGIGSAPQDLQPLLSLGGSRHVSAWCSVSRACSLLCPYLLEEVRTRVETDDEEVRAAGRTYRTPRRLLAPSAALVQGRAPGSAPNSPGGADCPSSPWCLCIHFRAA